jgi:large subunit ribosomal protein L15
MRPGFEGGQLPLIKRLPQKRGFTNIFKTQYSIINMAKLGIFEPGSEVTPEKLLAAGVVKSLRHPIKVLAGGEISHPLVVRAHRFSAAARAKIEAAGGQVEEVGHAAEAS